jgi:hypothetical protein
MENLFNRFLKYEDIQVFISLGIIGDNLMTVSSMK